MPTIQAIISHLESIAPSSYQESYDNAGLITGSAATEATGAICCLDATEAVVEEAIEKGCNLVVAHHPIVFKGLKRFNGRNYVERTVIKAIKNNIAIYAIHTNLDNVFSKGVNGKIAEKLGLQKTRILSPKKELKKLTAYVSAAGAASLRAELFEAGAGTVNSLESTGFAGSADSLRGTEMRLEAIFPSGHMGTLLSVLQNQKGHLHYEIVSLENNSDEIGSGMIGELPEAMKEMDFLKKLKSDMQTNTIRHTRLLDKPVKTVALCGGSGSFLLPAAIGNGADIYITGDFKYHEFFDADNRIVIADIGHFESEQFTIDLLHEIISEKFPNFAAFKTSVNTNPVLYL